MSQNISLWGASYSNVPSVTLPKTGGGTASFTDVTDTTATASDVAAGKYFYNAAGTKTQGTGTSGGYITQDANGYVVLSPTNGVPTLISKTITENGTYNPASDNATGYSSVTVNVSGGEMSISDDSAVSNQEYTLTFSNIQSAPSKFVVVWNKTDASTLFVNKSCVTSISYNGTTTETLVLISFSGTTAVWYKLETGDLTWSYSNSQKTLTLTLDTQLSYYFDPNNSTTNGYRLYYA